MDWRCNAARAASSSRTSWGTPLMVICIGMNALCHRRQHPASSSPQRLTKSDPAGDFCTRERERESHGDGPCAQDRAWVTFEGDGVHPKRLHRNHQIEIRALNVTMPSGQVTLADSSLRIGLRI